MHGIQERGIGSNHGFILANQSFVMPLGIQIERRVVIVFRILSGLVVGHPGYRGHAIEFSRTRCHELC